MRAKQTLKRRNKDKRQQKKGNTTRREKDQRSCSSWVDEFYLISTPVSSHEKRANDYTRKYPLSSPLECVQNDNTESTGEGRGTVGQEKIKDVNNEAEFSFSRQNEKEGMIEKENSDLEDSWLDEEEGADRGNITKDLSNLSLMNCNDVPSNTNTPTTSTSRCLSSTTSYNNRIRIASFNVLAEAYLTRRSHPGLPKPYADVVFDQSRRRKLLLDTIEKLFKLYDIICMQEVDLFDYMIKELNVRRQNNIASTIPQFGYCHSEVFGRSDRCCILYNIENYTLLEHDVVEFDDLARIESPSLAIATAAPEEENSFGTNATIKGGSDGSDCTTVNQKDQQLESNKEKNLNDGNDGTTSNAAMTACAGAHYYETATNQIGHEGRGHRNKRQSRSFRRRTVRASSSNNSSLSYNKPRNQRPSSVRNNSKSRSNTTSSRGETTTTSSIFNSYPLKGMISSFRRRNAACIGVLQHNLTNQPLVICSAHLFWNPGFEYVKLSQAKYLMERMHVLSKKYATNCEYKYRRSNDNCNANSTECRQECDDKNQNESLYLPPVLVCGDFNAQPGSATHTFLSKGFYDARCVAPWHPHNIIEDDEDEDDNNNPSCNGTNWSDLVNSSRSSGYTSGNVERNEVIANNLDLRYRIQQLAHEARQKKGATSTVPSFEVGNTRNYSTTNHSAASTNTNNLGPVNPRYMLDYTLNKFTRWLRILGLDAALETVEEEQIRVQCVRGMRDSKDSTNASIPIFDHCRKEGRVLLTTSFKLLARKDCPPGAYLIDPRSLEDCLCHLMLTHGVVLEPANFLSRCVVCNGIIVEIVDEDEEDDENSNNDDPHREEESLRYQILKANKAPVDLKVSIYACDFCLQCYWWSDKPNSAPSRVKAAVKELFRLLLNAGIPYKGPCGMFQHCVDEVLVRNNEEQQHGVTIDTCKKNYGDNTICLDSMDSDSYKDKNVNIVNCTNQGCCDDGVDDGSTARNATAITSSQAKSDNNEVSKRTSSRRPMLFPKVQALDWLKDSTLSHPFGQLQSVYAKTNVDNAIDSEQSKELLENAGGVEERDEYTISDQEMLPFTNVTSNFVGCLDYIFYKNHHQQAQQNFQQQQQQNHKDSQDRCKQGEEDSDNSLPNNTSMEKHCPKQLRLVERLNVPTTFRQIDPSSLNNNFEDEQELTKTNGHVLPSNLWPSDHLAIGATFELV